jgi:hypothetical protein
VTAGAATAGVATAAWPEPSTARIEALTGCATAAAASSTSHKDLDLDIELLIHAE